MSTITSGRTAVADVIRLAVAGLRPKPVVYEQLVPAGDELGPVAFTVSSGRRAPVVFGESAGAQNAEVTLRVATTTATASVAQDRLEQTVEAADGALRDRLSASWGVGRWVVAWTDAFDAYEAAIELEMFLDDPAPLDYQPQPAVRPAVFGPARVAIASCLADVDATVLTFDPYPGTKTPPGGKVASITPLALDEYLAHLAVTVSMTDRVAAQATFDDLIDECSTAFETLGGEYGIADWDAYGWDETLKLWVGHVPISVLRGTP